MAYLALKIVEIKGENTRFAHRWKRLSETGTQWRHGDPPEDPHTTLITFAATRQKSLIIIYYLRPQKDYQSLAYPSRLAVDLGSYVDGEAHGWAR